MEANDVNPSTERRVHSVSEIAKLAFWAVGILCFAVMTWTNSTNQDAEQDRQLQEHDREFERVDRRFTAQDLKLEKIAQDNVEVKTGIATLLERTKDLGDSPP
jgi:septal ring factor EnvC (AmiA/AmiB activator)